jgi:hypothetical protein
MGSLTEGMTQLCNEIVARRGARLNFIQDLGQNVAELKANLRREHADMARQTKAARQDFVKLLGLGVADLMTGCRRAHKAMARQTKAERRAAVNHLKKTVGSMCREFSLDLAGAHRVWCGPSPAERRAQAEAERRAEAEAKRAREASERDRLAALALAKEEAVRHHTAQASKEEVGRPGKKKG